MPSRLKGPDRTSENPPSQPSLTAGNFASTSSSSTPVMLAATAPSLPGLPPRLSPPRQQLPPLSQLHPQPILQLLNSSFPISAPSHGSGSSHVSPSTARYQPPPLSIGTRQSYHMPLRPGMGAVDRHGYSVIPPAALAGELIENRGYSLRSTGSSVSGLSTPPITTSTYPAMYDRTSFSPARSESSRSSTAARCSLHIRQQPRAARAGPDGKDRRPIDPPPILQLMMADFDPDSSTDLNEMRSTFWVVHCRLVSAQSPKKDLSTLSSVTDDGSRETQRLLLGTAVASPFHCNDDPDPETMPEHPVTCNQSPGPPSPSSRFLPSSFNRTEDKGKRKDVPSPQIPSTYFIFADLSVRKAGEYRLEFSLMKVEANVLNPGSALPITHSVTTQIFKVVNAKDFDQVQPSTNLVRGLLDRGAGFPLKLKKGTREGQRRRVPGAVSETGDESEEDVDLVETP